MAWSSLLGIFVCRFWSSLVFGFATRRPRDFIRFRMRHRMSGRRAGLTDAVEYGTRLLTFSFSWRTPLSHNSASTQFVWITRDSRIDLNEPPTKETGARWLGPSRAVVSFRRSIEIDLGFATPRRLGKHSQRICRLSAAFLLELRNPVGDGLNHVARRFTCGCCFCLNDWTGFLALLDNLDCFLLRHCFYFEFVESVNVSNEILATQFPKVSKSRTSDCDSTCKE